MLNPQAKPSLTIKRQIKAPPAKLFAAWTDPAQLVRWFGPDSGPVLYANIDLRVGGAFQIKFRIESGNEYEANGHYREIVPDQKLVFTWEWSDDGSRQYSLCTVLLKPDGAGTMMTFIQELFPDEAVRDSHLSGWTGAFNKLEALFA